MGYLIRRVRRHSNLMPVREDFISLATGLENEGFHSFLAAGQSIIWFLNNMAGHGVTFRRLYTRISRKQWSVLHR